MRGNQRFVRWVGACLLALALMPLVPAAPVSAAAFTVSNCLDLDMMRNTTPGSLRDAVEQAVAAGQGIITFGVDCPTFNPILLEIPLDISSPNPISNIVIDGSGRKIALDGGGTDFSSAPPIFAIDYTNPFTVKINALTMQNGIGKGAIIVGGTGGTLFVTNTTFVRNAATDCFCTPGGIGGAIADFSDGNLIVSNSTFAGNRAFTGTPFGPPPSFAIGGAIAKGLIGGGPAGTLTIVNSTFVGNHADAPVGFPSVGGAIATGAATTHLTNNTFFNNAANDTNGPNGTGGAIFSFGPPTSVTNTLFVNNAAATGSSCSNGAGGSGITDAGHNLEFPAPPPGTSCGFTVANGDVIGDPKLATDLADNGGLTQTLRLGLNSVAIGTGAAGACNAAAPSEAAVGNFGAGGKDQRGLARPQTTCAIGAYEPQPATLTATGGTPQSTLIGTNFAAPLSVTITDEFAKPTPNVTVTFTLPTSGASGSFVGGGTTAITNAAGVATTPMFTANTTPGTYAVTASAPGSAASVTFTLTNTAPGIVVTVTTLPVGIVGVPYSVPLGASGGTGPYQFTLTGGTLPAGLTLTAAGILSGTPTGAGQTTFTVTATDANGSTGTQTYTLTLSTAKLLTIVITNAASTVHVGEKVNFKAVGAFADASQQDLSASVQWTVSDPTKASVDARGNVMGLVPGTVTLTASANGITGTLTLTVLPLGFTGIAPPGSRASGVPGANVPGPPASLPISAPGGGTNGNKPLPPPTGR